MFGGFGQALGGQVQPFGQALGNQVQPLGQARNNNQLKYIVRGDTLSVYDDFDFSKYEINSNIHKLISGCTGKLINLHMIPPSINHFIIKNPTIEINNLADTIKIIEIEPSFNHKCNINFNNLPNNLHTLIIKTEYSLPLDNLPDNLSTLIIKSGFNCPIEKLPSGLKVLNLGKNFNHPIDNLPSSLECLVLGENFNHPISNLPPSLKKLVLGRKFNQKLENLPNLTHLEIENNELHNINYFLEYPTNPKLIENLPETCTTLISKSKNFLIDFTKSLIANIKKLHVKYANLPIKPKYCKIKSIQIIKDVQLFNQLPNGIEEMTIDHPSILHGLDEDDDKYIKYEFEPFDNNQLEDESKDESDDNNPNKKIKLEKKIKIFDDNFDDYKNVFLDFTDLPVSVKKLTLIDVFCECKIPTCINSLTLINCCEYMNFKEFPDTIKYLELSYIEHEYPGESFVIEKLPKNLEYLVHNNQIEITNLEELKYNYPSVTFIKKE